MTAVAAADGHKTDSATPAAVGDVRIYPMATGASAGASTCLRMQQLEVVRSRADNWMVAAYCVVVLGGYLRVRSPRNPLVAVVGFGEGEGLVVLG